MASQEQFQTKEDRKTTRNISRSGTTDIIKSTKKCLIVSVNTKIWPVHIAAAHGLDGLDALLTSCRFGLSKWALKSRFWLVKGLKPRDDGLGRVIIVFGSLNGKVGLINGYWKKSPHGYYNESWSSDRLGGKYRNLVLSPRSTNKE